MLESSTSGGTLIEIENPPIHKSSDDDVRAGAQPFATTLSLAGISSSRLTVGSNRV